jgi:uncharacterized cofD-like protein
LNDCHLVAELEDGSEVMGEAQIDARTDGGGAAISRVRLEPQAEVFDRAAMALLRADFVVIGPGDLYTSVMPNLAVAGLADSVREAQRRGARLVYIVNTMTKRGETDRYPASRFVEVVERALGGATLDAILTNTGRVPVELLEKYIREGAEPVVNDLDDRGRVVITGDLMARGTFARHDPRRLTKALLMAIEHLPPRPRPRA